MFSASKTSGPSGYNLTNSLRFRSSASAYLSRTPANAGNRQIWTWSSWFKRGSLGSTQTLFGLFDYAGGGSTNNQTVISINSSNVMEFYDYSSAYNGAKTTTQVFRDPSAWYHIVAVWDTTQATAANRMKLYINGSQVTSFSTSTDPSLNSNSQINRAFLTTIGGFYDPDYGPVTNLLDGYQTEINFIDGQALTPSSFGSTNATTGVWQPARYTGTYGTNGFYLNFSDIGQTVSSNVGLGKDFSGNTNYWVTNNIYTASSTNVNYDAMLDVPTLTSATVANYCVNNPVDTSPAGGVNAITILAANLNLAGASSDWAACRATIGVTSGKWYWECTRTGASNLIFGIGLNSTTLVYAYSSTSYGYFSTGDKYSNNVSSAYGASFTSGDVIGVAFDADAGTLTFYKNNTSQGIAFTGLTSGPYFPLNQLYTTGSTASINFGQRPFSYTPPSGFKALNTFNLPDSTIVQGNKVMDATLYTGTGALQNIVNAGTFQPDFVWAKSRSNTNFHNLMDSVRGTNKDLYSNSTAAEDTNAQIYTAINSNGFSVGTDNSANQSGQTFVAWQWQAGKGSTSSGTGTGGITSVTMSVNASAGFSIQTFTIGTITTAGTITHGLGVAPKFIITKARTGTVGWSTYHASLGNTQYVQLNTTAAAATLSTAWNNTSPDSTVWTVGSAFSGLGTYVAYCWAEIAGFSKFGSYTGNGSTDVPFIYLGFRPKFVMIKNTTTAGYNWVILDSARNTYNPENLELYPNTSGAEVSGGTTYIEDFLSNGFKVRQTDITWNGNGSTYIYAAFAENPFKNALAR